MTMSVRGTTRAATHKICRFAGTVALLSLVPLAGAHVQCAYAAPGIKASSEAPNDGPIKYTITMDSKVFGHERATRTIRSGQSDDFTWQEGGAKVQRSVPDACPGASNIPRSGDGSPVRQIQIRLTPMVESNGNANVQIMFQGYAPRGNRAVTVAGENLQCPTGTSHNEVVRFSMTTVTGSNKSITLGDGSKLTILVSRK